MEHLTPEELKALYLKGDFSPYAADKIFEDARYNYASLRTAPFFGEETLGIFVDIFKKLGEGGHSNSLYNLGLLYYRGEHWLEKDEQKSYEYHLKSAEHENPNALFELGVYHLNGIAVEVDEATAIGYFEKAARYHHHRACYNLGALYATGRGVQQDMEKAVYWYEQASDLGNANASEMLAAMYESGQGVEQDLEKAEDYYSLADDQRGGGRGF